MSHVFPLETEGNVNRSDENRQPPLGSADIGLTYVPSSEKSTLRGVLLEAEGQVIRRALQYTGWNRKRAAALLEISYRGLLYKIRRHSITPTSGG
jgi:DNA-binding NtrC family response regulator